MFPSGRSRDSFSTGWSEIVNNGCLGVRSHSHLSPGDTQEADGHEHPSDRDLVITELDSIQVLHAETVRRNQAVQSEDLVHLYGGNEGAPSLPNDRSNWGGRDKLSSKIG